MNRIGRALDRAVGVLSAICAALSAVLLLLMMLLVVVQVVLRQFFEFDLNLAIEMSGYAIAAITLLAAPYGLRSGAFIRVSLLYDRLRPVPQAILQFVFDCLGLVYVGLLTYYWSDVAVTFFESGVVSATGTGTPQYIPLFLVVFAAATFCVTLVVEIARDAVAVKNGTAVRSSSASEPGDTGLPVDGAL